MGHVGRPAARCHERITGVAVDHDLELITGEHATPAGTGKAILAAERQYVGRV